MRYSYSNVYLSIYLLYPIIMKKSLFLSLFFLASFGVYAQNFKKESSIAISVGPSFPVGEFANKNLYDERDGLASVGGYASIAYNYQFSRFFGAVAAVDGRIHGVDKNALKAYTLPTGSGASLSLETSTWRFLRAMVGVSQTVPITKNEKLALEVKELIGVQFSNSPEVKTTGFIPGVGSLNGVQESQSKNSFAYGLGIGLNYKVANKLKLKLFGEYQGSSPTFIYDIGDIAKNQIKQETGAINVGLGLAFGF